MEQIGGEATKLVYMANQIAAFFHSYPRDEATEGVRTHLKSFWTPRMLSNLQAQSGNAKLDPLVLAVLEGGWGEAK